MPGSYLMRSRASCGVEYTMTDAGDRTPFTVLYS